MPDQSQFGGHFPASEDADAPPELFTAILQQIGLRLSPAKSPVDGNCRSTGWSGLHRISGLIKSFAPTRKATGLSPRSDTCLPSCAFSDMRTHFHQAEQGGKVVKVPDTARMWPYAFLDKGNGRANGSALPFGSVAAVLVRRCTLLLVAGLDCPGRLMRRCRSCWSRRWRQDWRTGVR